MRPRGSERQATGQDDAALEEPGPRDPQPVLSISRDDWLAARAIGAHCPACVSFALGKADHLAMDAAEIPLALHAPHDGRSLASIYRTGDNSHSCS